MKILIVGKGYIASRAKQIWKDQAVIDERKIFSIADATEIIETHNPDVVFNAAGVTGKPNVDWCEDHQRESMLGNTLEPIALAEACQQAGLYLLHVGSGCVFYDQSPHSDGVWKEDDFANPSAVYSRGKYAADLVLSTLPNVGIARIRMPIDNMPSPRNLIDKLAKYSQIIDAPNSATIIEDMIAVCFQLLEKKASGIFHVVNPGALRHTELIALYQKYVDPDFACEFITPEELVERGLAKKRRSNNLLSHDRLTAVGITMPEIHESLERTMQQYAAHKKAGMHDTEGPAC